MLCLGSARKSLLLNAAAVLLAQNNPLFLQALDGADHIVYHHIVHACLDIVGEKCAYRLWFCGSCHYTAPALALTALLPRVTPGTDQPRVSQNTDLYLGFLTPVDDCRVYGYVTNTQVKFILVTADVLVRDSDMSSVRGKPGSRCPPPHPASPPPASHALVTGACGGVAQLFKAIHAAYVRLTSNPFAKVGGESITSARFESELHALVYQYDSAFART